MNLVRMALFPLIFAAAPAFAVESTFDVDWTEAISTNVGYMSFTMEGAVSESGKLKGKNSSNFALEWAHYFKKDLATVVGYRVAWDSETERTLYQAANIGMRVYPMTLGVPVSSFRSLSLISYDFPFKPYVELGGVTGRYLITTLFGQNVGDVSSEFIGFYGGGGVQFSLADRYGLDFRSIVEIDKQYGPIEFQAVTLVVTFGMTYYL